MDLSAYKDLSKSPLSMSGGQPEENGSTSVFSNSLIGNAQPAQNATETHRGSGGLSTNLSGMTGHNMNDRGNMGSTHNDNYNDTPVQSESEFSANVRTLIRLMSELPEGVTKQTGAQIIRLTMEAMGISMEDVLSEAQSSQSDMLDAVRANIKKIEEYKTVIRKLETDIKFYQGKANELSEIIDLFILSNTTPNNRISQLETMPGS